MRADLHMHSVCSDGFFTPTELARRVKAEGVGLFSLTDHDNLSGNAEAAREARALGLHFVRGIEVSSYLGATKVHMLGYGCRAGEAYDAFLRERVEGAAIRAEDALRKANAALSLDVAMEEVERYHAAKEAPLHTMHVVRAFAERLGREVNGLYRELFSPGGAAFSDLCRPLPEDAVHIIHAMGGLAVLAHPVQILILPPDVSAAFHTYTEEEKEEAKYFYAPARNAFMQKLAEEGVDGIECYHPTHTASETEEFLAFAKKNGKFVTGGSDFHADGGRRIGRPLFDAAEIAERLLALDESV